MSITKPIINKFLSLMLVLSVVITGLIPTTAVYASEVNTPGSKSSSSVTLTTEGLLLSVTVPTSVLIYVDEQGEVTTPDYLQITNHSIAPVYAHTLEVTPFNGWTLDSPGTSYKGTKLNNNKHYWLSFNGLDPSGGPINLATSISGHSSLNLDLLADVAPQREAIHAFNIGEIIVTVGWDINEDAQQGDQGGNQGGGSETENTGPNGEYIPEGYVLATDADFSGTQNGEFKYIGSDDYVVIPHVIKGVPVTFYNNMFAGTGVKGVASNNPNIVGMMSMFEGATSSTLELIYLDTSNVTDMRSMFKDNQATSLDLSNFDTSNVTLMLSMFNGSQATSLDLSSFNISQVTDMSEMFSESKATVLDLSSFDMSNFDGSNTQYSFTRMLWSCAATIGYARTQADADILNSVSGKPYDLTFYPQGYEPPETPETTEPEWVLAKDSDFNGFTDGEFTYKGTAEYVIIPDRIKYIPVTSYRNMFKGTAVKGVKSTNPNVTDMTGMFEDSTAESLDLSELNTSGVLYMANMFRNSKATTIDLSNFDTTKVTTMVNMFRGSYATTLDLSSFDLSNLGASTMKDMLTSAKATTGYARTEDDATKLNNNYMSGIPFTLNFVVK